MMDKLMDGQTFVIVESLSRLKKFVGLLEMELKLIFPFQYSTSLGGDGGGALLPWLHIVCIVKFRIEIMNEMCRGENIVTSRSCSSSAGLV